MIPPNGMNNGWNDHCGRFMTLNTIPTPSIIEVGWTGLELVGGYRGLTVVVVVVRTGGIVMDHLAVVTARCSVDRTVAREFRSISLVEYHEHEVLIPLRFNELGVCVTPFEE